MTAKKINLTTEVYTAITTLTSHGYKAYLVGGAVRDYIMEKEVSDFDITTDAHPDTIHLLFDKCIDTGLSHGTVTVVINHVHIEITTFRTESNYTDHRRPDMVKFSKRLSEDLSRRDFTMNALAYNPQEGIIDLFGGMNDICNNVIKTVGKASERFDEDALRMLRCVRFSSKLGFKPDKDILCAIKEKHELIKYVSKERIREEIIKTFLGEFPQNMHLFKDTQLLDIVFREDFFKKINHDTLSKLKLLSVLHVERLSYILNILYDHDRIRILNFLTEYKFSNSEKSSVLSVSDICSSKFETDKISLKRMMKMHSIKDIYSALDILSLSDDIHLKKEYIQDILSINEPYRISHLCINGYDLIQIGINGSHIGYCLDKLVDWVIENPQFNSETLLLDKAREIYENECIRKN